MTGPGSTESRRVSWRLTGARVWLPTLMFGLFVLQMLGRLYSLVLEPPPHLADGILFTFALLGSAAGAAGLVIARRTRVTLLGQGVEIRELRQRLVPYTEITRAYRNRFSRGTVTLDLVDARKVVLPAPVAGPKDPAPELDEAVEEINARVAAAGRAVEGGEPG